MKMLRLFSAVAALSASYLQSAVQIDCHARYAAGDVGLQAQVSAVITQDERVCIIKKSSSGEQHPTVEVKLLRESDTNVTLQFFVCLDEKVIAQPCLNVCYGKEASVALGTKATADGSAEFFELRCNAERAEK